MRHIPKKKKLGGNRANSSVQIKAERINNNTALQLSQRQIELILNNPLLTAPQERRFIQHVGLNPNSPTRECCRAIACVNLSSLRIHTAKHLAKFGLEARCVHPQTPIKNSYGESTGQVLWGLYRLSATEVRL